MKGLWRRLSRTMNTRTTSKHGTSSGAKASTNRLMLWKGPTVTGRCRARKARHVRMNPSVRLPVSPMKIFLYLAASPNTL